MKRQIIFVGGVHGVGKTQFCKTLAKYLHCDHITASELIRKYKNLPVNERKTVVDVEGNQDALIYSLNSYKSTSKTLLLDGHFCLFGAKLEIQRIPAITFERIAPMSVIVLVEEVEIIKRRLIDRDSVSYNLELIREFQTHEIEYARNICELLKIPHLEVNPNTGVDEAIAFLKKCANK